jgi:hypothetical protein
MKTKFILFSLLSLNVLLSSGCGAIQQVLIALTTPNLPGSVPPQASNLVDYTLPVAGIVSPSTFNKIVFHFTNSMNTSTFSIANNFTMPAAPIETVVCSLEKLAGQVCTLPTYPFYPNNFQWSTTNFTNDTLTLYFASTPTPGYTYTFDLLPGNSQSYLSNSSNQAYLSAPVQVNYTVQQPTGILPYIVNVTPAGAPIEFLGGGQVLTNSTIMPHEPLNFNFSQQMGNISVAMSPSNCCSTISNNSTSNVSTIGGGEAGFPTETTNLTVSFLSSDLSDPYIGPTPTMNMYGDPLTICFPNCYTPGTYSASFQWAVLVSNHWLRVMVV